MGKMDNPIEFSWRRARPTSGWEYLSWAEDEGPWFFDEPADLDLGSATVGGPPSRRGRPERERETEGLEYTPTFLGRNVRASAVHREFARLEPTQEGFAGFAMRFGRLGLSEPFDPPVSDGSCVIDGAEHFDTWVDCLNLVRIALAASWYDTGWQSPRPGDKRNSPPEPKKSLLFDQQQCLAREWLSGVDEVLEWKLEQRGYSGRSLFERVNIKTRRYTFSHGGREFVFDHGGGLTTDSDAFRKALVAALANDVLGSDVLLQADLSSRKYRFKPRSLWSYLWLELLTQMDARVDYRWCSHCGVTFLVAEQRTRDDRLFCSPECATANYEWRKKETARLAADDPMIPVEEIIGAIYLPQQVNSKPKRARAVATVEKWLAR